MSNDSTDPRDPAPESPNPDSPSAHSEEEMLRNVTECDGYTPHPLEYWVNLDDRQLRAVELIVQGLDDSKVARILDISRMTLWRWKTFNEDYRRALAEARAHVRATATDRYQGLLIRATDTLGKFLDAPEPNHQFRAAQIVLCMAGSFRPVPLEKWPQGIPSFAQPMLPEKMG
ncbi:MAG: helix-turn-helix domain-containing protein [Tepidisphaeraceae bacterium]